MIRIDLPWPSRDLHPNARVHWARRAKATKKARADAGWAAKEAKAGQIAADALKVKVTFFPPNDRRRDEDGMLANWKAYLDGIADVIGVDDSRWRISIARGPKRTGGAVCVEVSA